jgi:predicted ArsR family transcriptional regulator
MKQNKKRDPGYQKERGARQESRIIDALTEGPKTAHELEECLHLGLAQVQRYLKRLTSLPKRRVHVCGFDFSRPGAGMPRCRYDVGSKPSQRLATSQKSRILAGLNASIHPSSVAQVALRISMDCDSARRYVRMLRKEGRIHVAAWEWADRTPMPLYMAGKDEDAPKPTSKPKAAPRRVATRTSIFAALGL